MPKAKKAEEGKNPRTQVCGCEPNDCNHVCTACGSRYDKDGNSDGGVCDCNRPAKPKKEEKEEEVEEEKTEEESSEVEVPEVESEDEEKKED